MMASLKDSGNFRKSMSAENVSKLTFSAPSFTKEPKEPKEPKENGLSKIKVSEVSLDSEDERSEKSDEGQCDGKDESASKENSSTMHSFLHTPSVQQGIQKLSAFEESDDSLEGLGNLLYLLNLQKMLEKIQNLN